LSLAQLNTNLATTDGKRCNTVSLQECVWIWMLAILKLKLRLRL
jgi:hypothetical protein